MKESVSKGLLTGAAGGLVTWWAIDRFYQMARARSSSRALIPFCVGAGLGLGYGGLVLRRHPRPIARVPLGAAVYLAGPEGTASPGSGRSLPQKAKNLGLRMAARGLKRALEIALVE